MGKEDQGRVWPLYGWFTALMACGSCVGTVSWAAQMLLLINFFQAEKNDNVVQSSLFYAASYTWHPVFVVTYAVEFLFLSAAKLMVLDRMSVFAAPQGARLQKLWALAGRVVMAAVVLGNCVGLAANAAAAVHHHRAAQAYSAASAAYAANATKDGDQAFVSLEKEANLAAYILSFQSFCEVTVLLLIVVAFVVAGALCVRLLSSRLKPIDAAHDALMAATGRTLRRQMLGTTAFVFASFLLRAVLSAMYAVAFQLQDGSNCSGPYNRCAVCHNAYTHMSVWMAFTPEFEATIVLISSPLALLVALWGMTSEHMLKLMKANQQDKELTMAFMKPKKNPQQASS
jgi:hypothetical protein